MQHAPRQARHSTTRDRQAFTIIELMVVVTIIALVLAIILPALSGVRTSARITQTQNLLNSLKTAISVFQGDNQGRGPGYFSVRDMGSNENVTRGFTAMDNALLDLSGGVVPNGDPKADLKGIGPVNDAAKQISIDTSAYGSKKYFTPSASNWVTTIEAGDAGVGGRVGLGDNLQLPTIVDSFRNPIIMWVGDDSQQGPFKQPDDFALPDSSGTNRAMFYWASNAGILSSPKLGKSGKNQKFAAGNTAYSLVGEGIAANKLEISLTGALGHPSYPYRALPGDIPTTPAKPRGSVVVQSAGPDGLFFGSTDRGAKQLASGNPPEMNYRLNFVTTATGTEPHLDKDGKPTTVDIKDKFDDIVSSAGN